MGAGMLKRAVELASGNLAELAGEVGVSYHTLRAWADGRRNPSPANLLRLADVIERRGGELQEVARQLRAAAGDGEGEGH